MQSKSIAIRKAGDIVAARHQGRELALDVGFSLSEATFIATAISELSRNMLLYAKGGIISIEVVEESRMRGITVVASDDGPGIADLRRALAGGHSISGGLGLGLSGVRRLMDKMDVFTEPGKGTRVTATMWLR